VVGGDAAAARARGVQGHAAPAGADLDQVVARAQVELLAHALELALRGLLERVVLVRDSAEEYMSSRSRNRRKKSLPRS
jgi:hypothetical protein